MTLPRSTSGTTTVLHGSGVRLAPRRRPFSPAPVPPSLLPSVLVSPRSGRPATPAQLRVWRVLAGRASGERVDLGLRALAREAGVSEATARRAVRRFARLRLVVLHQPKAKGRGYTLGIEIRWRPGGPISCDADQNGNAEIKRHPPTPPLGERSKACHTDASASWGSPPYPQNLQLKGSPAFITLQKDDPDALLDPLRARRRVLGRVRDHVRAYPGILPIAVDRILNGVGAALARRWPAPGPGIRRGDVDAVARAVCAQLDRENGYTNTPRRAHGFGTIAVLEALSSVRTAARLQAEAARIEAQIAQREREAWGRLLTPRAEERGGAPERSPEERRASVTLEEKKRRALAALLGEVVPE